MKEAFIFSVLFYINQYKPNIFNYLAYIPLLSIYSNGSLKAADFLMHCDKEKDQASLGNMHALLIVKSAF